MYVHYNVQMSFTYFSNKKEERSRPGLRLVPCTNLVGIVYPEDTVKCPCRCAAALLGIVRVERGHCLKKSTLFHSKFQSVPTLLW